MAVVCVCSIVYVRTRTHVRCAYVCICVYVLEHVFSFVSTGYIKSVLYNLSELGVPQVELLVVERTRRDCTVFLWVIAPVTAVRQRSMAIVAADHICGQ